MNKSDATWTRQTGRRSSREGRLHPTSDTEGRGGALTGASPKVREASEAVPEPDHFARLFHALSPDAQAAALVYGVVDPHVCTVSQVVPILRHAGIQAHGRPLTNARLKDANRELVDAGLAFAPRRGGGLKASPHWAPWLTMEAHRGGMLDPLMAGHGRVQPGFAYYRDEARVSMELRCHTVAGRFDRLRGGALAPEAWAFLAEPGAAGLLRTLPEPYRDCALAGCLTRVIHAAAAPEPIIEACLELGSNELEFAADIAFIRILQGRLDDVDAVFDTLPPAAREAKRARTGRAGAGALVAMLRGDDREACRLIESAVAEERAGTRKRNVFPASPAFALSLLSLVRDDSPANRALLAPLLRTAEKQRDGADHPALRRPRRRRVQGSAPRADDVPGPGPRHDAARSGVLLAGTVRAVHRTDGVPRAGRLRGARPGCRLRLGPGGVSVDHRPSRAAHDGGTPAARSRSIATRPPRCMRVSARGR